MAELFGGSILLRVARDCKFGNDTVLEQVSEKFFRGVFSSIVSPKPMNLPVQPFILEFEVFEAIENLAFGFYAIGC
jgi:hypothetical protein